MFRFKDDKEIQKLVESAEKSETDNSIKMDAGSFSRLLREMVENIIDETGGWAKDSEKAVKPLLEGEGRGVQFEWAIVYWSLKLAGKDQELAERIKKYPQMQEYGEGGMKADAMSAARTAQAAGAPIGEAYHSDEKGIAGNPEPKTDIMFGDHRVSVKMDTTIQLASGQGSSTAAMMRGIMKQMLQDPALKEQLEQEVLEGIIERVENIPTKMIDPKNLEKALERKPKAAMEMMKDGELLEERNWKTWQENNKKAIVQDVTNFVENNPKFQFILVEEALTGKRTFGEASLATADYMCGPGFYGPIDDAYVKKIAAVTKIDVRAKSRSGITSATVRFDAPSMSKMAAMKAEENLSEGAVVIEEGLRQTFSRAKEAFKGVKEKVLGFATKWLNKFKSMVKGWFKKNIDKVVEGAIQDIEVDIIN